MHRVVPFAWNKRVSVKKRALGNECALESVRFKKRVRKESRVGVKKRTSEKACA